MQIINSLSTSAEYIECVSDILDKEAHQHVITSSAATPRQKKKEKKVQLNTKWYRVEVISGLQFKWQDLRVLFITLEGQKVSNGGTKIALASGIEMLQYFLQDISSDS